MKIIVNDVNFNAQPQLVEYAKKKAEKLCSLYEDILGVEVNFRLENNSGEANKTAEMVVKVPGNDLFAKKTLKTFEEATDATVEALRKQVERRKDRISVR